MARLLREIMTEPNPRPAARHDRNAEPAGRSDAHPLKLYIKSFGCQMNAYDAARMADLMAPEGYTETQTVEDADLVVLNTCHIRERAAEKIYSELGKIREIKEAAGARRMTLAVAGCVAQAEGQEIIRRQKAVDLVVGPQSYHRLPDLVRRARAADIAFGPLGLVDTDFPVESKFDHLVAPSAAKTRSRGVSAYVTVQEGCDKFCSFCVVPYTRGSEVSRSPEAVAAEVVDFAGGRGARDHAARPERQRLPRGRRERHRMVARAARAVLSTLPGLARIRYMTSHPNDMDADLISAHETLPPLMPFLHLPVQSGSDRILRAMNRKHSSADYLDLVARIRRQRPDIAMSSDFIVGFPGETEAEFRETLGLVEAVGFATSFSFKYSPRPGTPGAELAGQIDDAVLRDRLARLQVLLEDQRQAFNRATVGRRIDVLFDKPGRHAGQIGGRTPYLQAVHVEGPLSLVGTVRPVDILAVGPNSLTGRLAEASLENTLAAERLAS